MRTLALLSLALVTALPAALASTHTYVAGTHSPDGGVYAMCTSGPVTPSGACLVDLADPAAFTITVVDGLGNPVAFHWGGQEYSGLGTTGCGSSGEAFGSVSASFPPSCTMVAVWPNVGSFAGTITVE